MFDYYFTFRSVTPAQRGQWVLQKEHIAAELRRLPKFLSVHGCGYAIIVHAAQGIAASRVLKSAGISYGTIYKLWFDGNYEEVRL